MLGTKVVRSAALLALCGAMALGASACGGGASANAPDASDAFTIVVPPTLGGLKVAVSAKATKKYLDTARGRNTYVKDAQVFEMRLGKELQAVLQVVRLSADSRPEDAEFRRKVIAAIGGSPRAPEKLFGQLVYRAEVNNQIIAVWFQMKFMEIAVVRQDSITLARKGAIDINRLFAEVLSLKPTRA